MNENIKIQNMTLRNITAKLIRVVTVPPFLITGMLIVK